MLFSISLPRLSLFFAKVNLPFLKFYFNHFLGHRISLYSSFLLINQLSFKRLEDSFLRFTAAIFSLTPIFLVHFSCRQKQLSVPPSKTLSGPSKNTYLVPFGGRGLRLRTSALDLEKKLLHLRLSSLFHLSPNSKEVSDPLVTILINYTQSL